MDEKDELRGSSCLPITGMRPARAVVHDVVAALCCRIAAGGDSPRLQIWRAIAADLAPTIEDRRVDRLSASGMPGALRPADSPVASATRETKNTLQEDEIGVVKRLQVLVAD